MGIVGPGRRPEFVKRLRCGLHHTENVRVGVANVRGVCLDRGMRKNASLPAKAMIPVLNIRAAHGGMVNIAGTCIYCGMFVSNADANMVVIYGKTVMCEHCETEQGIVW